MSETFADLDRRMDEIAPAVANLGWRVPRVRDPAVARRMAHGIHAVLVHVAKGRGALDIAIGEGLAALSVGLRAMDLKYSNINDYAREELGINGSTAAKMERLARRLRELSVIRDAVRHGVITARKAEIICRVAKGNEAYWLIQAQAGTVRSLKAEVRAPRDPEEERWVNLCTQMPPEKRPVLDLGLALAGMVLEKPTASNSDVGRLVIDETTAALEPELSGGCGSGVTYQRMRKNAATSTASPATMAAGATHTGVRATGLRTGRGRRALIQPRA